MHTEIQNEQRNLVTLPNLFLVTKPFEVLPKSGTVVSATVSLGYDTHKSKIVTALKKAATEAELTDPFVHVLELGDFSVSYRISGLLKEVKFLVSARSELRSKVLDSLHDAGIEIVSPTFMNQFPITDGRVYIPKKPRKKAGDRAQKEKAPESIIFDKANQAESRDNLMEKTKDIEEKIAALQKQKSETKEEAIQTELEARIESLNGQKERILKYLETKSIHDEKSGSKV
jgi:bifunctional DNA-binding transcriptional regulator/antitoxin component of YhaV-PrlF toxin-antitoxin module